MEKADLFVECEKNGPFLWNVKKGSSDMELLIQYFFEICDFTEKSVHYLILLTYV